MTIYLDNNATTPVDPRVAERIAELLKLGPLNPGSAHHFGRQAREIFEGAKRSVLESLELPEHRVIFCGSASEATNLALRSFAAHSPQPRVATTNIEHPATQRTLAEIADTVEVGVGRHGEIDSDAIKTALRGAALCALMYANNETGLLLPLAEFAAAARETGVPLLVDCAQAPGKAENFFRDIAALKPDALVLSGHKMHAPVGIAALVVSPTFPIKMLTTGGGQQGGLRAGTEPVVLADAFALALRLAKDEQNYQAMREKRDALWNVVSSAAPRAERTLMDTRKALANTLHYRIPGLSAERQIVALDMAGVQVSSASACESGAAEPSKVMLGMGYSAVESLEGVRVSLSRMTSSEEIAQAQAIFQSVLTRLLSNS